MNLGVNMVDKSKEKTQKGRKQKNKKKQRSVVRNYKR